MKLPKPQTLFYRGWQTNAQYVFSKDAKFKLDIPFSSGANAVITKCYYNANSNSIIVYGTETAKCGKPLYDPYMGLADIEEPPKLK